MSSIQKPLLNPTEYLEIERAADIKSEFYHGEMFAIAGATEPHNLIAANVLSNLHLQLKGNPCRVYPSDLKVFIPATGLFTYPDVMVICVEPEFYDSRRDVVSNPILIVEVLSDSTEAYHRGAKFQQYRSIKTLQQYVLVSQDSISVESFYKSSDGNWVLTANYKIEDIHQLATIQCTLALSDVYDKVVII